MSKLHSASPSKSVSETPSSHSIAAAQILSNLQLSNWRGSITTFKGFISTRPDREFENIPWSEACNLLCPEKAEIIEDKRQGKYFIPCLLKVAPFVGSTLEASKKAGESINGKMRSKMHVTEAEMLIIDVDGLNKSDFHIGLDKISKVGIAYLAFTTFSHGHPDKPGVRARLAIPLDRMLATEDYYLAWNGVDKYFWNGLAAKADSSSAKLYQQQGTSCCHPARIDLAQHWVNNAGVASADALIEIGLAFLGEHSAKKLPVTHSDIVTTYDNEYPPADANKVADACKQIRAFRDLNGADQNEQLWRDSLGIVGFCEDGENLCHEWSSGHAEYDTVKTERKIKERMRIPQTTCAQFKKSNPAGCNGCIQQCKSPITLGWIREGFTEESLSHSNTCNGAVMASLSDISPSIPPTDTEVIATLAAMPLMEYDRIRLEKAKELCVQVKTLDAQVKELRNDKNDVDKHLFPEIEPYPTSIVPALLFDEISEIICRFVIVDKYQADTAALWIAHTYLIDIFNISPIAIINAPEKACAKTLFQSLLALMSYRSLPAANASTSALFRAVESWKPTIFFDEADTFFRNNTDLQGLVNAGYKRGGNVLRCEPTGESFEPRIFSVYCAKSIAGISLEKHLPDSTMSRGIIFNMRRKLSNETVMRMRNADNGVFDVIVSKLMRFALDYSQQIRLARPSLPEALSDRNQDNWEALLAIAGCAGVEWLQRATSAALKLSSAGEASVSTGNELLADIRDIFESKCVDKISSVELIKALIADDESPWATYNRGKPITPRQLAKMLTGYGIKSKTVRLGHANTPKGYDTGQFADVFGRYLPQKFPPQCNISPEFNSNITSCVADKPQPVSPNNNFVTLETLPDSVYEDVSNKTQLIDY